jgi:hypothetical protein
MLDDAPGDRLLVLLDGGPRRAMDVQSGWRRGSEAEPGICRGLGIRRGRCSRATIDHLAGPRNPAGGNTGAVDISSRSDDAPDAGGDRPVDT